MSYKSVDMICLLRYVRQCMKVNVNLIINIDKFVNLYHNKTARKKRIVLQGGLNIFQKRMLSIILSCIVLLRL